MRDFRYALRSLRARPVFTLAAALTLALGLGASAAIFGVLYDLVLSPLPYPHADRLVFVWNAYLKAGDGRSNVSIPDYLDRRAQAPAIEDAALFMPRDAAVSIDGPPEQVVALAVTPSFFTTLGRTPFLGRAFAADEGEPGHDGPVILTHAFWRSRFGGDPHVIGRTVRMNGGAHPVVGVLPSDFELPSREAAMLVPFAFTPAQRSDEERGNEFSTMIARLRPGATAAELTAQMQAIVDRLMTTVPSRAAYMRDSGFTGIAVDMREQLVGPSRASLYLLQGGVTLVLLIACANVTNLLLMKTAGRRRELAIRAALGAGAARLARQLLIEGAVLASLGAAGGIAVAAAGSRALAAMLGHDAVRPAAGGLSMPLLAFSIAVAGLSALAFGLLPALSAVRGNSASTLNEDGPRGSAGRAAGRLRTTLVIAEVALAVVLLVGAGLLVRSLSRLLQVSPGFTADRVAIAQLALPPLRYPDATALRAFWQQLLLRGRAIPGVTAVGLISELPFSETLSSGTYFIVGRPLAPGERPPHSGQSSVLGDYFPAMSIPIVEGRVFDERDAPDAPRVVVVDELFARRQFPGASPVGHLVSFGGRRQYTIVGVVGTVHAADLAKDVPEERIYFSAAQLPEARMALVARTGPAPAAVIPQIRAAVRAIDAEQPVAHAGAMTEWVGRSLVPRRTPMRLLAVFGSLALLLAAIGIYGVMAFDVAERRREFGIRQALGADRASILSLVLRHGLRTASAGLAFGLTCAAVASRSLASLLFGITPHDPQVLAAVCVLLFAVAALACGIPAWRATRTEPLEALRTG